MTPSIKKLRDIFGDNAPDAKRILQMTRAQLLQLPAGAARAKECYHPPQIWDIRMTCLNELGGFSGVEGFDVTVRGERVGVEYLNAGDTYTPTLVRFNGRYRVASWGDIAERYHA
jgi:hypothetical protein